MTALKHQVGRSVVARFQTSEAGVVVRPKDKRAEAPELDWVLVEFASGGRSYIHESNLIAAV